MTGRKTGAEPTPDELTVIGLFASIGLRAEPIPRRDDQQTPDLRIIDDTVPLLIEVKSKLPPDEWQRALDKGDIAELDVPFTKQNTVSGRMGEAERQLVAMNKRGSAVHLVVWVLDPRHADAQQQQIEATLLGSRHAMVQTADGVRSIPCFGMAHPDFARFASIDAVVLQHPRGAKLLANPFRASPGRLAATRLFQTLESSRAVLDVARAETAGELLVVDQAWRGRPEPELPALLSEKYNVRVLAVVSMVEHSATVMTESA